MSNVRFPGFVLTIVLMAVMTSDGASQETVTVNAPDGSVTATVGLNDSGRPMLLARLNNQPALKPCKLGITVDGKDLGNGVTPVETSPYTVNERYAWRGDNSGAHNHANGRQIRYRHTDSGQEWLLDVRVYDTGVGWRYIVPGNGTRRVNGESSTFHLPSGTELWYQDDVTSYENNFRPATLKEGDPEAVPNRVGPPATGILPGGGYVTLAESDVLGYSGMSLVGAGATSFSVRFHDNPDGWTMEGRIESPWRVAVIASDLNELVSSNLVAHLAPAPDEKLFPEGIHTDWLRSGRSWWTWYLAGLFGRVDRGKTLYRSDVLTGKHGPASIRVSLPEADQLILRTDPARNGNDNDHTNWANATLETADGERVRLSELEPVKSSQGWGSLKQNQSITGGPLRIGDRTFPHGLGTHSQSTVIYELDKRYETFRAAIGIDEAAGDEGSARFSVGTASGEPALSPDLSFLPGDRYSARIVHEGEKSSSFYTRTRNDLDADSSLSLPVRPGGGFLVILRPE